jgi:hypothetical protein
VDRHACTDAGAGRCPLRSPERQETKPHTPLSPISIRSTPFRHHTSICRPMNLVIRLEPIDEGHGHVSFVAVAVLLWLCYFIVASSSISGYASDAEVERRTGRRRRRVRCVLHASLIPYLVGWSCMDRTREKAHTATSSRLIYSTWQSNVDSSVQIKLHCHWVVIVFNGGCLV